MTQQYSEEKCPICYGTSWQIVDQDGHEAAKRCRCAESLILENKIKSAAIPEELKNCSFKNYQRGEDNQKAFNAAYKFVKDWDLKPKGLLITGTVGTGKTHLTIAIINNLLVKKRISTLFVNTPELVAELRDAQFKDSLSGKMDKIKECPLVCFDDLAKERMTEWVKEQYYRIINHRYLYKLPILATSNNSINDLGDKLGDATASRLIATCEVVEVKGRDRRVT